MEWYEIVNVGTRLISELDAYSSGVRALRKEGNAYKISGRSKSWVLA